MMKRLPVALLGMLMGAAACGGSSLVSAPQAEVCLEGRDGRRFCMYQFEASRRDATADDPGLQSSGAPQSSADKLPWTGVTWSEAKAACEAADRRLCERAEWLDACDGAVGEDEGTRYTYGDERNAAACRADDAETCCNTGNGGVAATGRFLGCRPEAHEIFDLSGNVWEWTGNEVGEARARGGAWPSTQRHECRSGDAALLEFSIQDQSDELGFRCCRDLSE